MLSYVIVGSGYRSEYFARIARDYPHLFRALYLCRSAEKVALMSAHTGIPATMSVDECLAFEPDFAVIAVDRPHIPDVAEEWLDRGIPVLVETPIANSADKLRRLWERGSAGDKIVCCEQYHRYPILAAGLRAVRRGRIGTPTSLYLSLLHDYHGASILRHALDIPVGEPVTMYGFRHTAPVVETDSRYGAVYDGRTRDEERDVISLSFASGKMALIDFSPVQYRSYIRSRHLTLRGDSGEWSDTQILWLDERNQPHRTALVPEIPEKYRCLDTQLLRDCRRNWSAELAPDTVQDQFAIATILLDMAKGKPDPYPLADALEDAYYWLLFQEAIAHPGKEIRLEKMPWHEV